MSVLTEIGAQLAALNLGVVGTTIFLGAMPATPDACCSLREYGGAPPEFGFGAPGIAFERPTLQIVFRGVPGDYAGPRAQAETAYRGLAQVEASVVGGTFYHLIHPQQAPFLLDTDDSKRVRIAFNVLCEKELSAA